MQGVGVTAPPCELGLVPQDGVEWSGVTVAFTVKAMDAGPVLAQRRVKIDPDIQVRGSLQ